MLTAWAVHASDRLGPALRSRWRSVTITVASGSVNMFVIQVARFKLSDWHGYWQAVTAAPQVATRRRSV